MGRTECYGGVVSRRKTMKRKLAHGPRRCKNALEFGGSLVVRIIGNVSGAELNVYRHRPYAQFRRDR